MIIIKQQLNVESAFGTRTKIIVNEEGEAKEKKKVYQEICNKKLATCQLQTIVVSSNFYITYGFCLVEVLIMTREE